MSRTLLLVVVLSAFAGCGGADGELVGVPANLEEAIAALRQTVPSKELADFKAESEDSAVTLAHFSLGMWMRNEWGLWADSPLAEHFHEMGIHHPDDMSSGILTSLHRRLNEEPLRLQDQIREIQLWWQQDSISKLGG